MKVPEKFSTIINRKKYNTETATLIADDEYWDGSNFERNGRNCFLYRTPNGAYFTVNLTQWQGERNTLTPVTQEGAKDLYEQLPEHEQDFEAAFGVKPEEA